MRFNKRILLSLPGVTFYTNPTNWGNWGDFFTGTSGWFLSISVSVILLFLVIGGLVYITSAGQEDRMRWAKRIILAAIVGFFVILLAASLIMELKKIL